MADIKISALPPASTITGAEIVPLNQGGVTSKAVVSNIFSGVVGVSGGAALVGTNDGWSTVQASLNARVQRVSLYTNLQAISPANAALAPTASVMGRTSAPDGGMGIFDWITGDQSANVTFDTQKGIWVPPSADLTGASGAWKRRVESSINPFMFGGIGDGSTDDTTAIVAMCSMYSSGYKSFDFLYNSWKVTMANNAALVTFTSTSGISINGNGAEIYDPRVYTGDPIAPVFDFVTCTDCEVNLNYRGAVLASPTTQLGYLGGTFIRWRNGSSNLRVNAQVTNARYGILSGAYADTTQGNNTDIKARLKTSFCGYSVAFYWTTNIEIDIDCDNIHRAAYLAGVNNGYCHVAWSNQYIADVVVLLTDALTGVSTQVGCSNLDVRSYDKGSTVFQASSSCIGIANSRVGPVTIHENLTFNFCVVGNDTISTRVGGFKCASGPLPGGEPFFWEPTTILRNITISGVVDRTGQTLDGNAAGEVYWVSNDTGAHVATVTNIKWDGVTIIPSSGSTRNLYFEASGLTDRVVFDRLTTSGFVGLRLATNSTIPVIINDSSIPALVSGGTVGKIICDDSDIGTVPDSMLATGAIVSGSSMQGSSARIRVKRTTLTLTGASVNWASSIPAGCLLLGIQSRILTTITGATGYQLGVSGDLTRYANVNNLNAGLTTDMTNSTETSARYYTSNTTLTATAKTSNFTGGTLAVWMYYFDLTAPTS